MRLSSECNTKTVAGEKDHLYYTTKAKEKLLLCINNSGHSPEFKQTLLNQLQELQMNNLLTVNNQPSSKKCLDFQFSGSQIDLGSTDTSASFVDGNEMSILLEKSILQDQLDAKEIINQTLQRALVILKSQADLQLQPQAMHPQQFMPPHAIAQQLPRLHEAMPNTSFGSDAATPVQQGNGQSSGINTPTDLWWDSLSPQASFERGYFAGLAEHVEQVREQSGEGVAPTLRDQTDQTPVSEPSETPDVNIKTPTTPTVHEGYDIYVEPIVKLTAQSGFETGEEDETTKFVHRAKLYRFDKDASSWKERGLGDVKILVNDKTNKARITMRREAVFRVCCNHFITQDMALKPKANTKAAWTWFTPADAAEGEVRPEQFTIKFKTQETADQFKDVFIECQILTTDELQLADSCVSTVSVTSNKEQQLPSLDSSSYPVITSATAHTPNFPQHGTSSHDEKSEVTLNIPNNMPPEQNAMALFKFETPENAITESPEGRPIFSFATSQAQKQNNMANPFLSQPISQPSIAPADTTTKLPTFGSFKTNTFQEEPKEEIAPSPFARFSFKIAASTSATSSTEVTSTTSPSSSPFAGFSFSSNPPVGDAHPTTPNNNTDKKPLSQSFPLMSSLPKDTTPVTTPSSGATPPSPNLGNSPVVIASMTTLPVFEKGVVHSGIDSSSFWTSVSPQKTFFTGNTSSLETIGHMKEEPREVDEDEFFKENLKASNENEEEYDDQEYYNDGDYFYGDNECYGDYRDNEYYGDHGDYDYDPDEDFTDDVGGDETGYESSKASSSRKVSSEEENSDRIKAGDRDVEDRFNIQKKNIESTDTDIFIDDDISITFEKKPSFVQKIKALRLKLPSTFYLYEMNRQCPGCRGCLDSYTEEVTIHAREGEVKVSDAIKRPVETASHSYPTFGSSMVSGTTSFAHLAASSSGFNGASGAFSGAGAQLFGSKQDGEERHDDDYDAIVQVKKLENVKTGEEDDEVLFKHRAKLYRFDGQWKERGVGDIKLTRNTETGYCRVIMRRDMIHKLCANHAVMPNMDLVPLVTSDKSLVWFTTSDYSEGTSPQLQKLCVKFKNNQIAVDYKEKFEVCKELMAIKLEEDRLLEGESLEVDDVVASEEKKDDLFSKTTSTLNNLAHKFSAKRGQWKCTTCLIRNEAKSDRCVSCNTVSPSKKSDAVKNLFGTTPETSSFFFNFGSDVKNDSRLDASASTFIEAENSASPASSPSKYKEKDADIHVEAIVQVSKLDSITTGEEDEEIVFVHRAKLYRFDSSSAQWKERGIGDVKLMHNKSNNTCRVLMRREQIHKLCANHSIMSSMELKPMNNSDKAWTWFTQADFSDGKIKPEQFALRFKTAKIAANFREGFEKCKGLVATKTLNVVEKPEKTNRRMNLMAKFAPKPGSWSCSTCLIRNGPACSKCLACETPNPSGTSGEILLEAKPSQFTFGTSQEEKSNPPKFQFGTNNNSTQNSPFVFDTPNSSALFNSDTEQSSDRDQVSFVFGAQPTSTDNKVSAFEADPNTWECPSCLAKNAGYREVCRSCNKAKEKTPVVTLDSKDFSAPQKTNRKMNLLAKFAPQPGSWSCSTCLVRNGPECSKCLACETPNPSGTSGGIPVETKPSPFSLEKDHLPEGETLEIDDAETSEERKDEPFSKTASAFKNSANKLSAKPGQWKCPTCLIRNDAESDRCVSCNTVSQSKKSDAVKNLFGTTPETSSFFFNFGSDVKNDSRLDASASTFIEAENSASPASSPSKYKEKDADIHVEAIVQVSKLDSITTGEEDEEIVFVHRAKLYRFDSSSAQWKERGIGDVKLMHNKSNNTCRVLMRREQIHKLCANHSIMSSMELKPMNNSDKAWTWFTQADFSDGKIKPEQFALRFKTAKIAANFREGFEKCKGLVATKTLNVVEKPEKTNRRMNLMAKFAPKPGSWSCSTCLIRNGPACSKCLACETPNPSGTSGEILLEAKPSQFTFGTSQEEKSNPPKFQFGTNNNSTQNSPFVFDTPNSSALFNSDTEQSSDRDQVSFVFGAQPTSTDNKVSAFEADPNTWECPSCLAKNAGYREVCRSCNKAKEKTPVVTLDSKDFSAPQKTNRKMNLLAKFAPQPGSWSCSTCLVRNGPECSKCLACETPNPSGTSGGIPVETKPSPFSLEKDHLPEGETLEIDDAETSEERKDEPFSKTASAFKNSANKLSAKPGQWKCPTCLIRNDAESDRCVSCNTVSQSKKSDAVKNLFGTTPETSSFFFNFGSDVKNDSRLDASASTFIEAENSASPASSPSKYKEKDADIHVEAIVQVSKLDSITTGEEDEEIVFVHRAKLYRFDSSSAQWKERGIGDVKLMHNKSNNTCRVLMRREQIHKLCANHSIMSSMELKPMNNSDKAWTWFTQADFSDGKIKPEQFALRFKTAKIAANFREGFEKCKGLVATKTLNVVEKPEKTNRRMNLMAKFAPKPGSWSCSTCLIRNGPACSKCLACETPNPSGTSGEILLEAKPSQFTFGTSQEEKSNPPKFQFGTNNNSTPNSSFTFGIPNSSAPFNSDTKQSSDRDQVSFVFGAQPTSTDNKVSAFEADPNTWECPSCLAKNAGYREVCRSCNKAKEKTPVVTLDPKDFSAPMKFNVDNALSERKDQGGFFLAKKEPNAGFSFGQTLDKELMPPPAVTVPINGGKKISVIQETSSSWIPKGLNVDSLFSFGTTPSPSLSNASSVDDIREHHDMPSAFSATSFDFQLQINTNDDISTPDAKEKTQSALSPVSPRTPEDGEDDADSASFVPLVTLSQVSHSTGEENEEILFEERSKMFRFDGQWKERGIGELKILRNMADNHHRLIMRRDQTHKLCANHGLAPGINIKPMAGSTKAFVWKTIADISDGEPTEEMFAARFKDEEKAQRFVDVLTQACESEAVPVDHWEEKTMKVEYRKMKNH